MDVNLALVADEKVMHPEQPAESSFVRPPVATERVEAFDAEAGHDAPVTAGLPILGQDIGLVHVRVRWPLPRAAYASGLTHLEAAPSLPRVRTAGTLMSLAVSVLVSLTFEAVTFRERDAPQRPFRAHPPAGRRSVGQRLRPRKIFLPNRVISRFSVGTNPLPPDAARAGLSLHSTSAAGPSAASSTAPRVPAAPAPSAGPSTTTAPASAAMPARCAARSGEAGYASTT